MSRLITGAHSSRRAATRLAHRELRRGPFRRPLRFDPARSRRHFRGRGTLTYSTQRLLTSGRSLAREFKTQRDSKIAPVNGRLPRTRFIGACSRTASRTGA